MPSLVKLSRYSAIITMKSPPSPISVLTLIMSNINSLAVHVCSAVLLPERVGSWSAMLSFLSGRRHIIKAQSRLARTSFTSNQISGKGLPVRDSCDGATNSCEPKASKSCTKT